VITVRATLALLMFCGVACTPQPSGCSETPTTSKVINGYTIWGKGDEVFLVFYIGNPQSADRLLRAMTPEKMLVVVDHPLIPATDAERIPSTLDLVGRNLTTGTSKTFHPLSHVSELGTGVEWGTNFEFPDAGCWELQLSAPRNATATIVLKIE